MDDEFLHRRRFWKAYEQVVASLGGWQRAGIPRSTWYSARRLDHVPFETTLDVVLSHRTANGEPLTDELKRHLFELRSAAQAERDRGPALTLNELPSRVDTLAQQGMDALTQIEYLNYMANQSEADAVARDFRLRRDELIVHRLPVLDAAGQWDALTHWGAVALSSLETPEQHPELFQRLINIHARRGNWAAAEALLAQLRYIAYVTHNALCLAMTHVAHADYALTRALHGFNPSFSDIEPALREAHALATERKSIEFLSLITLGRVQRRCQRYAEATESFREVANDASAHRHGLWAALAEGNLSIVNYNNRNLRRAETGLTKTWKGVNHLVDFAEIHLVQASIHFRRGEHERYALLRIRGEQLARDMGMLHPTSSTHAELMRLSGKDSLVAAPGRFLL